MEITTNKKAWPVLGIAALLLLAFFVYTYGGFQRHNWRMNLKDDSKEPYGLQIAKTIVEQSIAQDSFVLLEEKLAESLPAKETSGSNYVFIGESLLFDSLDVEQLLDFVVVGNTAFISSLSVPDLLIEEVYNSPCDSFFWEDYNRYYDTAVITNFVHPDLKADSNFTFPYVYQNRIYNTYWEKIDEDIFCDSIAYPIVITRSPEGIVDMIKISYGEGAFYLQTSPVTFTNYFLTKKKGQQYAEKAFAHLVAGPIYWDGFSNVPLSVGSGGGFPSIDPLEPKDGPLDYVLSQPPLAWAWYLLLALALLFILFRAKRRQRMIPVLEQNRNTSLEFISTISRLHFTGDNHYRIAVQKMELLEGFIRSKYRLSFDGMEGDFIKNLSLASEVEEGVIKKMFLLYTNIKSSKFTTDKTLIELHKLTDYFHKNCR